LAQLAIIEKQAGGTRTSDGMAVPEIKESANV
jgi:hypothetical protein